MSKPKVFEKPSGVKDYLPEAASKLRAMEWRVLQCMERWGYRQIITPTLEYYDTVGAASSTANDRLFKLLDNKGRTLVLRSEMTAPIARVVSSLLKEESLPIRLSHHSHVFRAIEEEAGREAEFVQSGVELVGDASAEADAEVIALAVACLQAAGVHEFKIAIGHIGFLNGVLHAHLEGREEDQQALKECLLRRDYVGYRHYLSRIELTQDARRQLEAILRLRGGQETGQEAEKLALDEATASAVRHLGDVWQALQVYGVTPHVLIDLTMVGNFSYYTGLIFEGYADAMGFPVCSGGRYDNLLTQFGRPAPATGFALETNRIVQVTNGQLDNRPRRVLVVYTKEHREEAITAALTLRAKQGYAVETRCVDSPLGDEWIRTLDGGRVELDGCEYDEIVPFDM